MTTAALINKPSIQILMVDDDETDVDFFNVVLRKVASHAEFATLPSGDDVLERLGKMDPLPDIIFLDLNMPGKDGHEVLKEIRANEKLKNLAVVIYSTSSDQRDIDLAFREGANLYVNKPTSLQTIQNMLQSVLNKDVVNWPPFKGDFVWKK